MGNTGADLLSSIPVRFVANFKKPLWFLKHCGGSFLTLLNAKRSEMTKVYGTSRKNILSHIREMNSPAAYVQLVPKIFRARRNGIKKVRKRANTTSSKIENHKIKQNNQASKLSDPGVYQTTNIGI